MTRLLIALVLSLIPAVAHAYATPKEAYFACKALDEKHGAYTCSLQYIPQMAIMVVRKVHDASSAENSDVFRLRELFFEAGGDSFEIHGSLPGYFNDCTRTGGRSRVPYTCAKTELKHSFLNRADQKKKEPHGQK